MTADDPVPATKREWVYLPVYDEERDAYGVQYGGKHWLVRGCLTAEYADALAERMNIDCVWSDHPGRGAMRPPVEEEFPYVQVPGLLSFPRSEPGSDPDLMTAEQHKVSWDNAARIVEYETSIKEARMIRLAAWAVSEKRKSVTYPAAFPFFYRQCGKGQTLIFFGWRGAMTETSPDSLRADPDLRSDLQIAPAPASQIATEPARQRWRMHAWIGGVPAGIFNILTGISLTIAAGRIWLEIFHAHWLIAIGLIVSGVGLIPLLGPPMLAFGGFRIVVDHASEAPSVLRMYWRYLYGAIAVTIIANLAGMIADGVMEHWTDVGH